MISQSYSHLLLIYTFLEHWRLAGWRELEIRSLIEKLKASSGIAESKYDLPSPRQILRLWLPSPKLGRGVGGEGKIYASYPNSATPKFKSNCGHCPQFDFSH
jgi:hypothetical protein